jgi:signal transduction histidine kinase
MTMSSRLRRRGLRLRGLRLRFRFTALYAALFLLSGAVLLVITYLLAAGEVRQSAPVGGQARPPSSAAVEERLAGLQAELDKTRTRQSRQLLTGSAVALGVMVAVSAVLGRIVAGRVLRPLRDVTAATRRISADTLHERLAVTAPQDEVKDLADTIDGLLERLEGAFESQRRFAANAAHELRTPLTTMRAALDVAMAKPPPIAASTTALADRLRAELDQTDQLLEALLALAHGQRGRPGDAANRDVVSLDRLVAEALNARSADVAGKSLTVQVWSDDGDGGTHVLGSQALLSRAVDNVIDNAVKHNEGGGWILAAVTTDGPVARLVVETGGRVLDPGQVGRLTEPFRRLTTERTGSAEGSGLGLSIVAAIAASHGGRVDLQALPEGGLQVTLSLPRVASPAQVPA